MPMNKILVRLVALLLICCVVADPATASALHPLSPTWERAAQGRVRGAFSLEIIAQQALQERSLACGERSWWQHILTLGGLLRKSQPAAAPGMEPGANPPFERG